MSFLFKLKSHPDRLLFDHLNGVHQIAMGLFDKVKCDFPDFIRDDLKEVISVISLCHDFGKATTFFQNYIENPDKPSTTNSRLKRRHGLVSAMVTFQLLQERLSGGSILPVLGFIVVRKHHGDLEDYRNLLCISEGDMSNCSFQADHIDYTEMQQILPDFEINRDSVKNFCYDDLKAYRRKDREFSVEHYFVVNLLYSILLQADKKDAILHDSVIQEQRLFTSKNVRDYKNRLKNDAQNPIHKMRESAFQSVENSIDELMEYERILSVNIPTGSGKTITSFYAAVRMCEKFGHDHIVYCLPFTSVIDQNFKVFDDIRKNADMSNDSGVLLKHHHLTDIRYQSVTDDEVIKEYLPNEALHLIEGWESRITVTTFVQFALSLISNKNSSLRKFHRFSNAVLILDEVQSIPHHYWKLINEMLSGLTKFLHSRIVLVTATMPLIFSEQDGEIKELVANKKEMFASLNRIELDVTNLKKDKMEWPDFCDRAKCLVDENKTRNILFVMNTVRSAKELFEVFRDSGTIHELYFLSAHVIPKHRLQRITEIKDRKAGHPILVVSTQLVEAGVDIDLDIVVRDFAPLDNIFQTCGRCNRENRDGAKGRVLLFSLKDSNDWTPSGIYESFLKQKTKKILRDKEVIPESEFFNLAHDYFNEVQIGGSQSNSDILLKQIKELKYDGDDGVIELNLIDDNHSSSVFIELEDEAKQSWNEFQNTLEMESGFEKNSMLKQARRNLAEYIINIPQKCLPDGVNAGIYHLKKNRLKEYYDPTTGFDFNKKLPVQESSDFF